MRDPLNPSFYDDVWSRAAENNTKIYRRVFRCMPDSEVTNWAEYKEFESYNRRFKASMDGKPTSEDGEKPGPAPQAAAGAGIGAPGPASTTAAVTEKLETTTKAVAGRIVPSGDGAADEKRALANELGRGENTQPDAGRDPEKHEYAINSSRDTLHTTDTNGRLGLRPDGNKERRPTFSSQEKPPPSGVSTHSGNDPSAATSNPDGQATGVKPAGSQRRRRRATTRGSRPRFSVAEELLSKAEAEELLNLTQGPLVQFPYDWLVVEEANGNWLFQVDQVAPLAI
jgi:phospholipase D1/2